MTKIKAVLFDLDDTLISEHAYIESGYRFIAQYLSNQYKQPAEDIYQKLMSLFHESPKNVFNRLLDFYRIAYTKDTILEIVEAYRHHYPDISFFNDVSPFLSFLEEQNIHTGIITDGFAKAQRQKLKAIHAEQHFQKIIVTDELGSNREFWKPNPLAFRLIQEDFNVSFEEMLYIGDNPEKDFYIRQSLPIKTVRIFRNGVHTNKEYYNGIKEHHSIYTLGELSPLLRHEWE